MSEIKQPEMDHTASVMQAIARGVAEKIPGMAFMVVVSEFGEAGKGRTNFVSNGNREDSVAMLRECADSIEEHGGVHAPDPETPLDRKSDLRARIRSAINRTSSENGSNTPDFILAQYLLDCLDAFDKASKAREKWYGRADRPGRGDVERDPNDPRMS